MARPRRYPVGTPCFVEGCDRPLLCRGYCRMHYSRWFRLGEVGEAEARQDRTPVGEHVLWRRIQITGFCWEWTGIMTPDGYGRVNIDRERVLAHRAVYEELVGPIPEGLVLDHLCRVRHCVNPDHLEPVTVAENNRRGLKVELRSRGPERVRHSHKKSREKENA